MRLIKIHKQYGTKETSPDNQEKSRKSRSGYLRFYCNTYIE